VVLLSLSVTGCLKVSSDAAALRNSVAQAIGADWNKEIEVSVGFLTLTAVRTGLSFVDLPPEARCALQSVKGAEVGVYRRNQGYTARDGDKVLQATDTAMNGRGWDRMVTVMQGSELIAIYVPRNAGATRDLKTCLVVLHAHEMVVASARGNLEPLVGLAFQHIPKDSCLTERSGQKQIAAIQGPVGSTQDPRLP
jgi:hypothetical protein